MSRRDQLLIGVVGSIAALAAFWFLLLSPQRKEATELNGQVAAARQTLQAAETESASYSQSQGSYRANYRKVARLGKAAPVDDDVRSLLVQVQAAARSTGVDFRTVEVSSGAGGQPVAPPVGGAAPTQAATATLPPGATVGTAGLGTMPFTFSFRGSFFELADFFAELEDFVRAESQKVAITGRLLQIDSIDLQPDQDGFPQIRAAVTATAYLVPPGEGLFAGATPVGPAKASVVPVTDRSAGAQSATGGPTGPAGPTGGVGATPTSQGAAPAPGGSAAPPITTPGGTN